ncbi:MAG TPA: Fe-S protein assembly co-chaperone HscB [Methylophilaceae bacterium]|nr:Fe-S protein assembly co-chaperone HscB [Methylophilaceae bacterium]
MWVRRKLYSVSQSYFDFFRLPAQYDIDLALLDNAYRSIQAEVHPDKFVTASPAERLKSMQIATLANEAYQTLKHPTSRARYLLHLNGVETQEESNTAMPTDFLITQMEWREAIEEAENAKDVTALDQQLMMMKKTAKSLQQVLATTLSNTETLPEAAKIVRKLSFIDKVSTDVGNIIARLED